MKQLTDTKVDVAFLGFVQIYVGFIGSKDSLSRKHGNALHMVFVLVLHQVGYVWVLGSVYLL